MFEVATFAQTRGWQPSQVRQIYLNLGIPAKASERSLEDWQRLERALEQGPDLLAQENLPPSSKLQTKAAAFTTWSVSFPNGTKGQVIIPGLDRSLIEREDGSRDWLSLAGVEVKP